ncbi:MAG: phosphoribosyltransferase [Candidatus ainarchaeum sp.]|jgi:hypoxanthine phosphoribosyltransferase|nr:phosphoribosyltransferase [Candidatus ainarchaeum sp.]
MVKIKLTYTQIENDCKKIFLQLKKENYIPDVILGISVGGLFPAIHLSRLLDNKNLFSIAVKSYSKEKRGKIELINFPDKKFLKNKTILIVDEIVDSGKTIQFISSLLKEKYKPKDVKIASIYVNKKNCASYPDFYSKTNVDWLIFPWDRFEKV